MEALIRPARLSDLSAIRRLISHYAAEKRLLKRSESELKKFIRTFFVAELTSEKASEKTIIGCAALEIYSKKLAEVRSLAVNPHYKGLKIGSALVKVCLERAKKRKIKEVMAITSSEKFFEKQGFSFALPHEKKALFYWVG